MKTSTILTVATYAIWFASVALFALAAIGYAAQ